MRSGSELRTFLAAQGVDLGFVQETAEAHTGTAIITLANADNTIVVVPGANGLVSADDVARARSCQRRHRRQPVRNSAADDQRFFKRARAAGATTILNPAPAIAFGAELLDLVDILILNETELGLLAGTELRDTDDARALHRSGAESLHGERQDHLRDPRQARRAGAGGRQAVDRSPAAPSRPSTPPAPAIALSARSPRSLPAENRSAMRWTTPMSRHRSACNGWAPRRRCRQPSKSKPQHRLAREPMIALSRQSPGRLQIESRCRPPAPA